MCTRAETQGQWSKNTYNDQQRYSQSIIVNVDMTLEVTDGPSYCAGNYKFIIFTEVITVHIQ